MNGGYRFFMLSRKLPGFRKAVKPRPVGGDRSHGATFFYSEITGNGNSFYASRSFSRLRIRVTRKTSSIVVTPAKTFCAPSWRRFVIPRRIASSWI